MAALVAVSLYFIIPPSVKTRLGLDLQGGLEIVYQAKTADGKPPSTAELDQTIGILDRRVNGLGVTESAIQKQGTDQISVSLPGVKDAQQALDLIGKTAQLEFYKDDPKSRPVGPVATKEEALKQLKRQGASQAEIDQLAAEGNTDKYALVEQPADPATSQPEQWYVFKRPPALTGEAISGARAGFSGQNNKPNVLIDFTGDGSKKFQEITRELYRTGLLKNTPQTFAIVLDNVMESDPMIDYTDPGLRDGISGGNMAIKESQDLAFVLKTGALPVKLEPTYQQQVSATLGKDSLKQGLIAGLVGLGIVLIYMLVYYRFLGLVADLALIVYGILLWGLFSAIPVTLTLPGIAGMILTIGVAADANVVIFERIKEEVRHGKTVRSAVNSGYSRGIITILDANILIVLTALVLFLSATQQIKGFALTLMIGVAVSMVTAVLATRALLGILAEFSIFNRPALMGVTSMQIAAAAESVEGDDVRPGKKATARRTPSPPGDGRPATAADAASGLGADQNGTTRRPSTARKKKRKRR